MATRTSSAPRSAVADQARTEGCRVRRRLCPRAGGVCLDVDLTPDRRCQFNCVYCSVAPEGGRPASHVDVSLLVAELSQELDALISDGTWHAPGAEGFRHVSLSGQGEPTTCPEFAEVVEALVHLRAQQRFPFFKMVLMTNGVGLCEPDVIRSLQLLCREDELWIKLDAGTPQWMTEINRPAAPSFDLVLANILHWGRQRPVVVQSLFPQTVRGGPPSAEIASYVGRLQQLVADGAQISQVQIYSASRTSSRGDCGHLPLRVLSDIARQVREGTHLSVEVF